MRNANLTVIILTSLKLQLLNRPLMKQQHEAKCINIFYFQITHSAYSKANSTLLLCPVGSVQLVTCKDMNIHLSVMMKIHQAQ